MENKILFGNGINRLSQKNPSWEKLLDAIKGIRTIENGDLPYTMIYERILMKEPKDKGQSIFNGETHQTYSLSFPLSEIKTRVNECN